MVGSKPKILIENVIQGQTHTSISINSMMDRRFGLYRREKNVV